MRSKDNIVTIFITIGPKNVTISLPNFERRHLQEKTASQRDILNHDQAAALLASRSPLIQKKESRR